MSMHKILNKQTPIKFTRSNVKAHGELSASTTTNNNPIPAGGRVHVRKKASTHQACTNKANKSQSRYNCTNMCNQTKKYCNTILTESWSAVTLKKIMAL